MRAVVLLAAGVIAVLAAGVLIILGAIAMDMSNVDNMMRWNDNDDRKGK